MAQAKTVLDLHSLGRSSGFDDERVNCCGPAPLALLFPQSVTSDASARSKCRGTRLELIVSEEHFETYAEAPACAAALIGIVFGPRETRSNFEH